jgi:hypothetical protein
MNSRLICHFSILMALASASFAAEFPSGVPPLTGMAIAQPTEGDQSHPAWNIALILDKDVWDGVWVAMPKMQWPELKSERDESRPGFRLGTLTLPMGVDSQPAFCRVVGMHGQKLGRDQVLRQLKAKTPVLISVSGKMPDARYLRLPTAASVIVLLGPGNKQDKIISPLATAKESKDPENELKDWTKEKSQRYFLNLMAKTKTFKIETKEKAAEYLRGIWRLDKRAHIGGGHYVRADRGDDVTVICTGEWLVKKDFNHNETGQSESIARIADITVEPGGSLRVNRDHIRFMPLDDDHMAVLTYDYIAVVQRIDSDTPEPPADGGERPSTQAGAKQADEQVQDKIIAATKAHVQALLTADKEMLNKSYAAKVRLLQRDKELDREQVVDAALKKFASGGKIPDAVIRQFVDGQKIERLKVTEGEYSAPLSARSKDAVLRFEIEKGDAVVRIISGPASWFLQFRKAKGDWTVVAEYTD